MTAGLVGFFTTVAVLLGFYAVLAPVRPSQPGAERATRPGATTGGTGMFDKYVRPAVRNLLPQTPASLTESAARNQGITAMLARSGNPWRIGPEEFVVLRLLSVVVITVVAMFLVIVGYLPLPFPAAAALGALGGFLLPKVLLDSKWSKRKRELNRTLPEALDLLRICMNAGYNFANAVAQTTELLPPGTTRDELTRVVAELRAGRPVVAALESLSRRCPTDGIDAFVRAIAQAQATGTDIATTLAYQAADTRAEYERAVEVKAQRLQTTLFLPIIGLFLPALMIFTFGPSVSLLGEALG